MKEPFIHRPALAWEVVELFRSVPPGTLVDATTGGGGHSGLLLAARPDIRLLGIDRDPAAVEAARAALAPYEERATVVQGGFEQLTEIVNTWSEGDIVGVLFDLGVSSPQLDRAERGFSYWGDAPLDMRMDSAQSLTAADVVNTYSEDDLVRVFISNGEERFAGRIARVIIDRRPLTTTAELVDAIRSAIPAAARRRGGHPARRTFQAIRIEVNRELENLAEGLDESVHLLTPGGRVLVLAYHSLEDRIVKRRFADWSGTGTGAVTVPRGLPEPTDQPAPLVRLLTRRPLRATDAELALNPRVESARLRAVERLA